MAPLKPHWAQPSHPDIQQVIINEAEFTSKSLSKVSLPPFAVFAKMSFPPCSLAEEPTYATVQMGQAKHLNLNSDLLYINHSCDPSLIFDTGNLNILVGHRGLEPGDELTFFYPSTEWDMAQPFQCLCKTSQCRGLISGAKYMNPSQLEGYWLNQHIRDGLDAAQTFHRNGNPVFTSSVASGGLSAIDRDDGAGKGLGRRGPSSRELSGEMGGDTIVV